MMKDIRDSALYKEMEALHVSVRRPGTGQISDAAEASVAPDARMTVFSATVVDRLDAVVEYEHIESAGIGLC